MNIKHVILFTSLLLSSCVSQTSAPDYNKTPYILPTRADFPTQAIATPTTEMLKDLPSAEGARFLTEFSEDKNDWQVIPGTVTAEQLNAEVARQEGNEVTRDEQKVINGFLLVTVQNDKRMFEALYPAELVDGKLKTLSIKSIKQFPILSVHAVLLEDYFEVNFPDTFNQWIQAGTDSDDLKYAAIVTITWATKYGPLRISYKMSGKYITEAKKYPGQVDFMKICMFEQTKERPMRNYKPSPTWYPAPIVAADTSDGEMRNDAFGWTPMADFAKAEDQTLREIGESVHAEVIESAQTLQKLQSAFDRAFMPIYCVEPVYQ